MSKNQTAPVIIGIGEILWDNLPTGRQLGGAPTNFAYHAKALGADAYVASCVGNDADGAEIRDRLRALAVNCSCLAADAAHPTGTVEVTLDAQGVPTFTIRENVAWDFIPTTASLQAAARNADAVCFGSLAQRGDVSHKTIQAVLEATPQDCLRIFDINLRQTYYNRSVIEQSLRRTSVLKLNDQELPIVGKLLDIPGDGDAVIQTFLSRYRLKLVALTRGGEGSTLYAPGLRSDNPGQKVNIIDTVGAGDAFTAAVAVGLLKRQHIDEINIRANRLAAYVCSQPGATPRIPPSIVA